MASKGKLASRGIFPATMLILYIFFLPDGYMQKNSLERRDEVHFIEGRAEALGRRLERVPPAKVQSIYVGKITPGRDGRQSADRVEPAVPVQRR